MLTAGLNATQQKALASLLKSSHSLNVSLEVLDLDHRSLGTISNQLYSGSVSIDRTRDVSRSMTLDLVDTKRALQFGPDDPDDGAAFPTRMIRCSYMLRGVSGGWYTIPIFTGPVSKVERDGVLLRVECQGKESLSQAALWSTKTYAARWAKSSIIRNVMQTVAGETRFDFETTTATTSTKTVIQRTDQASSVWAWARRIANSMGMQLFYDGRGYLRLRKYPSAAVWIVDDSWFFDEPQLAFSLDNLVNAVEVTGGTPRGAKNPITYRVVAPATHPLSPVSLGRGGVPRYLPAIVQNTDLLTTSQAKTYGEQILQDGLLQGIDATFEAFVVPHLEEADLLTLVTDTFSTSFRLNQATIPLISTEGMSIGYTKNVRPAKLARAIRRK